MQSKPKPVPHIGKYSPSSLAFFAKLKISSTDLKNRDFSLPTYCKKFIEFSSIF